jgi:hypothetical protein
MSNPRIDPSLSLALSSATPEVGPLNVFLKIAFPSNVTSADERATKAADLIRRVEKKGQASVKFQYRALDNVLHVKAHTELVRRLIREPEVIAASSVPLHDSAMIKPIDRREVSEDAIDRPFSVSPKSTSRRPR